MITNYEMTYLVWQDLSRTPQAEKIQAAAAAYARKFGAAATVALVNLTEVVEVVGLSVQPSPMVQVGSVYVGREGVTRSLAEKGK